MSPVEQHAEDLRAIWDAYEAYQDLLRSENIMDFGDQKLKPMSLLRSNRDVQAHVQAKYDEIVVDESQDLSRLDAWLLFQVLGRDTTIVLAGDDDQSLYEFREANSLSLREPERHFGRSFETIHLSINYRTPENVLRPAVRLISHNIERIEKNPHSGVHHSGELLAVCRKTELELRNATVEHVKSMIGTSTGDGLAPVKPSQIAFLCANSEQADAYKRALRNVHIKTSGIKRDDARTSEDSVFVDSMISAKGQQWRVVVLPDCSDSRFPGPEALRTGDIESRRRMLYMAMTRASATLIVGYVNSDAVNIANRTSGGEIGGTNGPSRFLFESGIVEESVWKPAEERETSLATKIATPAALMERPVSAPGRAQEQVSQSSTATPNSTVAHTSQGFPPKSTNPILPSRTVTAESITHVPATSPKPIDPTINKGKKKRATAAWDLREAERSALRRARERRASDDYVYALADTWKVVEQVIRRVTKDRTKTKISVLINACLERGVINDEWFKKIDRWRKLRNKYEHDELEFAGADMVLLDEIIESTPALFEHMRSVLRPKQTGFLQHEVKLLGLTMLADAVQNGRPSPLSGKPIRALTFDPLNDGQDMIVLQLLFILRDIRYFTPEDCRWDTSHAFRIFLDIVQPSIASSIRPLRTKKLNAADAATAQLTQQQLLRILENESLNEDSSVLLFQAIQDAKLTSNGNYPSGLKLKPKW